MFQNGSMRSNGHNTDQRWHSTLRVWWEREWNKEMGPGQPETPNQPTAGPVQASGQDGEPRGQHFEGRCRLSGDSSPPAGVPSALIQVLAQGE